MPRRNLRLYLCLAAAGGTLAAPLATQGAIGNSTSASAITITTSPSTRSSTTVFWGPGVSTATPFVTSAVGPPVSGSTTSSSSAHTGPSTVTIPWSNPTGGATSSQSVHVITITSPWPSVTPTRTVTVAPSGAATGPPYSASSESVLSSSSTGPPVSAESSISSAPIPESSISSVPFPTTSEATSAPAASTVTLAPEVVTVTATPEQPAPGAVTVVDTTVTVYVSSGILTVLPTVTVTASEPYATDVGTTTTGYVLVDIERDMHAVC